VSSANGALQGPGTNTINSVSDGETITANSGRYGFWLNSVQFTTGAITPNGSCIYSGYFCALPQATPKLVFDSNSQPLDGGRIRMDIAAAASYTNNPGEYTDTLTFIATATY
jgi:hypothetical protein